MARGAAGGGWTNTTCTPAAALPRETVGRLTDGSEPIAMTDEVLARWPALYGASFAVDATGLGRPIVDALQERISNLHAVTITGGENVNRPAPPRAG